MTAPVRTEEELMPLFSADALNPGVRKREVFGWAMYDFANSGYTTVVITAVFAAYFVGGIAGKAQWAAFAWTAALSVSYAIVMLTMPSIGAYADLRAAKKRLLAVFTAGCVASTAALALARPGSVRSEEHTSELQSRGHLVCRLLLEKKKKTQQTPLRTKKKNTNVTSAT